MAGGNCVRVRGTVWNTLKWGGTENRGGETKIFKKGGGQAGSRGGCPKKEGGLEPLYEVCFVSIKFVSISWNIDSYHF